MVAKIGRVDLGDGPVKVVVPLTASTPDDLLTQASVVAATPGIDIVEWRVDLFSDAHPDAVLGVLPELRAALGSRPLLATFRTAAEGGREIAASEYVDLNVALIDSGLVDAVDVEHLFDAASGDEILDAADARGIPVIGSNHDFAATPKASEIVGLLRDMHRRGMAVSKIAVTPTSPDDVLTVFAASRAMRQLHPEVTFFTIAMGSGGVVTRLAGHLFGSCATFAMVGTASAPGQVPVDQLRAALDLLG